MGDRELRIYLLECGLGDSELIRGLGECGIYFNILGGEVCADPLSYAWALADGWQLVGV